MNTGDKNYFYWAFESRNDPANDPVVLWHTGGPGCSGMLALVVENGPCHLSDDGMTSSLNPYSWNNNATLIYIDQPTGTGFSYGTDYDHNETEVGDDMYDFLQQWLDAHDDLRDNDFYVFGESYGGQYDFIIFLHVKYNHLKTTRSPPPQLRSSCHASCLARKSGLCQQEDPVEGSRGR